MLNSQKTFLSLAIAFGLQLPIFAQTMQDGIILLDNEKYNQAKSFFQSLIKTKPSAEAYYNLGDIYATIDNLDSASINFKSGLALDSKFPLNTVGLGKVALLKNDSLEAKKLFSSALEAAKGKKPDVYYAIGKAYMEPEVNKNAKKAIEVYTKAIELNKTSAEYLIARGDAYFSLLDGSKSATDYDNAIRLDPKSAKAKIRLGYVYVRSKAYQEALKLYNEAITINPAYFPAYRERGELLLKAGQYEKGREDYKKYLDGSERNPTNLYRYARFLFFSKKYEECAEQLNQIIQTQSKNAIAYRLLGYSLVETKKFTEGNEKLSTFFTLSDSSRHLTSDYEYFGKSYLGLLNDSLGVKYVKLALKKDSTNKDLRNFMATYYYDKKNFVESAMQYEALAILKASTASANDYLTIGRAYYFGKDYVKADTNFSKVIQLAPNSPYGYLFKARCQALFDKDSKLGLSLPHYEKFISTTEADPKIAEKSKKDLATAYLNIAFYYWQIKNDKPKAKELYNKVLVNDAENKLAKDALKDIDTVKK